MIKELLEERKLPPLKSREEMLELLQKRNTAICRPNRRRLAGRWRKIL